MLFTETPINNDRYISLTFEVCESSVLHGFAGYFDSVLYDDLTMSEEIQWTPSNPATLGTCQSVRGVASFSGVNLH